MDSLFQRRFNFSSAQLTTSRKIAEHAVMLCKVRLKKNNKDLKAISSSKEGLGSFDVSFFLLHSLT